MRISGLTLAAAAMLAVGAHAQTQERPAAEQIAAAVLPLPDSARAGAAVLGYRGGKLVPLRAGTNGMICLADNPKQAGFQASCYHKSLEPFMARGRSLRAAGITDLRAIDSVREVEIRRARIPMPKHPAMLASAFLDDSLGDPLAPGAKVRSLHVIYMAYATEASTGIPGTPVKAGPWLMYPGKPWAHVMLP